MTDTTVTTTTAYPKFETVMLETFPDYQWEAVEATTEDGYELTFFHLYKDGVSDDTLPPVFFQHGGMMSADSWLGNQIDASSPFFALVDDGHHVYLGNNRGNEYSQSHESLTWPSAEFYDYDYSGYFEDVAAQTSAMMDNYTGSALGIYIGFSMGTLQWLGATSMGALGVAPYNSISGNIQHAILLAPCTLIEGQGAFGELTNLGIYSVPSDDWEVDQATICDTLGAESANCGLASYATAD